MKLIKIFSLLTIMIVSVAVFSQNSSKGVQLLTETQLNSYIGACTCKTNTNPNAKCTVCQPAILRDVHGDPYVSTDKWDIGNGGSDYTKKYCASSTPDGCTPVIEGIRCSSSRTIFTTDTCGGMGESDSTDCWRPSANGTLCTNSEL